MGNPTVSEAVQPRVPPPRAWGRACVSIATAPQNQQKVASVRWHTLLFFLQKAKWFWLCFQLLARHSEWCGSPSGSTVLERQELWLILLWGPGSWAPRGGLSSMVVAVPPRGGLSSVAGGRPSPRGTELRGQCPSLPEGDWASWPVAIPLPGGPSSMAGARPSLRGLSSVASSLPSTRGTELRGQCPSLPEGSELRAPWLVAVMDRAWSERVQPFHQSGGHSFWFLMYISCRFEWWTGPNYFPKWAQAIIGGLIHS